MTQPHCNTSEEWTPSSLTRVLQPQMDRLTCNDTLQGSEAWAPTATEATACSSPSHPSLLLPEAEATHLFIMYPGICSKISRIPLPHRQNGLWKWGSSEDCLLGMLLRETLVSSPMFAQTIYGPQYPQYNLAVNPTYTQPWVTWSFLAMATTSWSGGLYL